jgi:pimeloyl-ACP methyl ester carboxylesterase
MKRASFLTSGLALGLAPVSALAQTASPAASASPGPQQTPHLYSADDVKRVIAANRKIVSPSGVEELLKIDVNGCAQWLSIRGRDRHNPVLLYIHGGPGSPTMPEAWTFQSPWEDYFTVVQWDQRGAGKTYASNDPALIAPTMTGAQMIADTEYVVRYLLEHLGKKKLFALGHSWGSYLGLELVRRHPELLHAYIGTGQMINSQRSEKDGYDFALRESARHDNTPAVAALEKLAPYPGPIGSLTVDRISAQRQWVVYYGGLTSGRSSFDYDADAWRFSPEYTARDIALTDEGGLFSLNNLVGQIQRTNFDALVSVGCPIFIFQGRHDYETSYAVARQWFGRVRAPSKKFVTFENSSHMAPLEQPGQYLQYLVELTRPLAVSYGDRPSRESTALTAK